MIERERLLAGVHAVASALGNAPTRVRRVLVADGARNPRVKELAQQARESGVSVDTLPRERLDKIAEGVRHQDVLAEFDGTNLYTERDLDGLLDILPQPPLVLVLDEVQDPHNLGACLRTAEGAGVGLVVITRDRSASLTPVARRAASGAAEVLPILEATNLARVLRRLKERGIWLYGTDDEAPVSLWQADLDGPLGLVMGAEGSGLRRLTRELCDHLVRIPMAGCVESLNVSVATGVALYEIQRRRSGA